MLSLVLALVSPAAAQAVILGPCADPMSPVYGSAACTCAQATSTRFWSGVGRSPGVAPAVIVGTCFDLPAKATSISGAPLTMQARVLAAYKSTGASYAWLAGYSWDPFAPLLLPVSTEEPVEIGPTGVVNGAFVWINLGGVSVAVDTAGRRLERTYLVDTDGDGFDDLGLLVGGVWYEAQGPFAPGALLVVP